MPFSFTLAIILFLILFFAISFVLFCLYRLSASQPTPDIFTAEPVRSIATYSAHISTINNTDMPASYEVPTIYQLHNEKNRDPVLIYSVLGFGYDAAPAHLDKAEVDHRMRALSMPVTPLGVASVSRRHSYHSRCVTPNLVPCSPPTFAHEGILESALKANSLECEKHLGGGMGGREGLADYALMFDD